MDNTGIFKWTDKKIMHQVFIAGSVYFALHIVYSLFHLQEKFFLDGCSLIFHITNWEWFPPPAQRDIVYLQQIFPVIAAIIGLKIKYVMIAYILNVFLFYYSLFLIVLIVFKDPISAFLIILLHYKGDPYNYFLMVEELLPGSCLVVVFLSLLRNFKSFKNRYIFYSISLVLLFFIIRSHPLSILCLAGGLGILFFTNKDFFLENKKSLILVSLSGLLLISVKFFYLNPYDSTYIGAGKDVIESTVQLLNPDYFFEMLLYLFYARKFFTITMCVTLVYLIINRYYMHFAVLLILITVNTILFNTQIDITDFKLYKIDFINYDRWSLPIRFVVFSAFSYMFLTNIKRLTSLKIFKLTFLFYFFIGIVQITEAQEQSKSYIEQANKIISKCRKQNVTKAIIMLDELDPVIPLHNRSYQDIMVLSALSNTDSCVQAICVREDQIQSLLQIKSQNIILHEGEQLYEIEQDINSYYYKIRQEPYKIVSLKQ